ncbi:MAG: DUF6612 family protein [Anaerovoracaceae bacterium]
MKKGLLKKTAACGLSLVMVLGLAACGGGSSSLTTEELMTAACENLESLSSMSYDIAMSMEMVSDGETVQMNTSGTADYITKPMKMKMDMTTDMGDLGSAGTTMYMVEEDEKISLYSGVAVDGDSMMWTKMILDDPELLTQYNAKESLNMYISNAESFKANGTEKINGSSATRYDGIISEESMDEVMKSSGMLSQTSALGMSENEVLEMLTGLGDLSVSIWIDDEKCIPVQYEIDMTEMMQKLMNNLIGSMDDAEGDASQEMGLTFTKVVMNMTLKNFDSVENFDIPAEALDAELIQ